MSNEQITTGTVGMYGDVGFDIVTAGPADTNSQPYAVIIRSLVRDTVTNELKIMLCTSRYSNASSILGTMAADVFPLIGRPQVQDLMEIPKDLIFNQNTTDTPARIATVSTLVMVAGVASEAYLVVQGGTAPYTWFGADLPRGVKMSLDGTLSGTPMSIGTFQATVSVKDSSSPEFIDTLTFDITVQSNLAISTATLPDAKVMAPYTPVQLVSTGGIAPFSWSVVGGSLPGNMTLDLSTGVISGTPTTNNSTTDFTTPFAITVQIQDAIGAQVTKQLSINLKPADLSINPNLPSFFMGENARVAIGVFGGTSPYTVQMTDSGGAVSNLAYTSPSSSLTGPTTDGEWEFFLNPPVNQNQGPNQNFNLTVTDAANQTKTMPLVPYSLKPQVSPVGISNGVVDHLWMDGDTTSVPLALTAPQGYALGDFSDSVNNGIQLSTHYNPSTSNLTFSQIDSNTNIPGSVTGIASIPLMNGPDQIASLSHEYVVSTSRGSADTPIVGDLVNTLQPYFVGDLLTINPLKPFFNSPSFTKDGSAGAAVVKLAPGQSLPSGLSLDSTTGLIYGYLRSTAVTSTQIDYVVNNLVTGTVTLNWRNYNSVMSVSSSQPGLPSCTIQVPYSGYIQAPRALSSAQIIAGRLPIGLQLNQPNLVEPTKVTITGTTMESGYFDVWFQLTDTTQNSGYFYQRFVSNYVTPLAILTDTLDTFTSNYPYSFTLQGFGGTTPYTWSITSGALPSGITLNASTGVISGTYASLAAYTGNLGVTLTDSRGVAVTSTLSLILDNTLTILTTNLPNIVQGSSYSAILKAKGGVPPYHWSKTAGTFPSSPSNPIVVSDAGVISGTGPDVTSGPQNVTITLTDSASAPANTTNKTYSISVTATAGLLIDSTGMGPIVRGGSYLGTLKVTSVVSGAGTPPYSWSSSNISTIPGLSQPIANSANQGLTATVSGRTNAKLDSNSPPIYFTVVDSGNLNDTVPVHLISVSSVDITTPSFPSPLPVQGMATAPFTFTFQGATNNGPLTWTWNTSGTDSSGNPLSLPAGFSTSSFSSTGVLSGTPTTAGAYNFTVTATDSIGDSITKTFLFNVILPTLRITTTFLPTAVAGLAYTAQLQASGGSGAYSWSVDSTSANVLPYNLGLTSSNGTISGSTLSLGTLNITWKAVDTVSGAWVTANVPLTVVSNLQLVTGVDYSNNLYFANGNFEQGIAFGWATPSGNMAVDSTQAQSGTQSLHGSVGGILQNVFLIAGVNYTLAGWIMTTGANNTNGSSGATLQLGGPLSGGVTITGVTGGSQINSGGVNPAVVLGVGAATPWTRLTMSFTVATSGIYAVVLCPNYGSQNATGTSYWDNITLDAGSHYLGAVAAGDVTHIAPRPNNSFSIIAIGVISTSIQGLTVTTSNSAIAATVGSLTSGVAVINLSGNFVGQQGDNSVTITLVDSGVSVSATFRWLEYTSYPIALVPGGGSAIPSYFINSSLDAHNTLVRAPGGLIGAV